MIADSRIVLHSKWRMNDEISRINILLFIQQHDQSFTTSISRPHIEQWQAQNQASIAIYYKATISISSLDSMFENSDLCDTHSDDFLVHSDSYRTICWLAYDNSKQSTRIKEKKKKRRMTSFDMNRFVRIFLKWTSLCQWKCCTPEQRQVNVGEMIRVAMSSISMNDARDSSRSTWCVMDLMTHVWRMISVDMISW